MRDDADLNSTTIIASETILMAALRQTVPRSTLSALIEAGADVNVSIGMQNALNSIHPADPEIVFKVKLLMQNSFRIREVTGIDLESLRWGAYRDVLQASMVQNFLFPHYTLR